MTNTFCTPKATRIEPFQLQNVFVITDYSGVDPEIPGVNGIDGSIWPRPRTYSLRLNVNF